MQGCDATVVARVGIAAGADQILDHRALRDRIPVLRIGASVGGVVERFGAPAVPSTGSGSVRDEGLGELTLIRGGRDMQSSVAGVHVMVNRGKEVLVGCLAARAGANRARCEIHSTR